MSEKRIELKEKQAQRIYAAARRADEAEKALEMAQRNVSDLISILVDGAGEEGQWRVTDDGKALIPLKGGPSVKPNKG